MTIAARVTIYIDHKSARRIKPFELILRYGNRVECSRLAIDEQHGGLTEAIAEASKMYGAAAWTITSDTSATAEVELVTA